MRRSLPIRLTLGPANGIDLGSAGKRAAANPAPDVDQLADLDWHLQRSIAGGRAVRIDTCCTLGATSPPNFVAGADFLIEQDVGAHREAEDCWYGSKTIRPLPERWARGGAADVCGGGAVA